MTLARTKEQWLSIFAEQTDGSPKSIGKRIISDLWGYNIRSSKDRWRQQDIETMANALDAYGDMIGDRVEDAARQGLLMPIVRDF